MNEPDLGTVGDAGTTRFRDTLRFNQVMGLVIVLGALVGIVWLTVVARRRCSDPDLTFVAYVPGVVELRRDTQIDFYDQCVGRIDRVEPGVAAVQVTIERPGPLGERESITLSARDGRADVVGNTLSLQWASPREVQVQESAGTWSLQRRADGLWAVAASPEGASGSVVGATLDDPVRDGTRLRFGDLELQWSDVGRFTRIEGSLDASAYERIADNVGLPISLSDLESALGAGTAVKVGSTIGIGTSGPPRVRLVPSYRSELLVAARQGHREFSPEQGTNVMAFLGEAVDYLASPGKTDAPPVNRYERMIDDFNGSLVEMRAAVASARKLADTLGAVADGGGDQLAGRLIVGERQLAIIESALGHIDTVLTTVESNVHADPDAPLLVNLLFDDQQAESLDRTIANVRELSTELRDGSRTVFTRIAGDHHGQRFDSIMVRTERLSARAESMLSGLEASGGSAARGAKVYGIVTALAQALSTIAVLGIWR